MLITDYREGLHQWDRKLAQFLINRDMPIIHVLNKCDNILGIEDSDLEKHQLEGLGRPLLLSAEHKLGLGELAQAIHPFYAAYRLRRSLDQRFQVSKTNEKYAPDTKPDEKIDTTLRLALIGRANVGKSTMLNKLIGQERVVVSSVPGTTRDTIELATSYEHDGKIYQIHLADTAGLRKKKHIADDRVQTLSHEDTIRTIRYANVVCLLVDAQEPLTAEDIDIARMVEQEGRGMIVAANKWDVVKEPYVIANRIENTVTNTLSQVKGLSVVVCSALTGKNLALVIRKALECYKKWDLRIPTAKLNAFLEQYLSTQSLPAYFPKVQYITQVSTRPPKFAIFFKGREVVLPTQFERQLLNAIRDEFDLGGIPIRIIQKSRTKMKKEKKDVAKNVKKKNKKK